jgi:PKD repeat protein
MNNYMNSSHMRYFHDFNSGYNNHSWFTITMNGVADICFVTWSPDLTDTGYYEVKAFIPFHGSNTTGARYKIHHDNGTSVAIINQSANHGQWASLGIYHFTPGVAGYVYLGDSTGVGGDSISFDAVKWEYIQPPVAAFTASGNSICEGETVVFINTSQHSSSCLWTFDGGMPATSSQYNPAVVYNSSGTYNVSLVAAGNGGSDTALVIGYVNVFSQPVASFIANDTIVNLPSAIVTFTNTSTGALTFSWDFGDGATSTDSNPYHIYTATGTYLVTLIAANGICTDSVCFVVTVEDQTAVQNISLTSGFSVYPNPSTGYLNIYPVIKQEYVVQIISVDGKDVFSRNCNGSVNLDLSGISAGIYLLRITSSGTSLDQKLVIE